eukprot:CAMPEP_0116874472 /NCGR_PEP_ID=MMETSP0463-20121206/5927_1 /TAXON_ID=181622 /ORGANISM="Strombidinopsis sp, Strain SopsisLIS2011" /LENGTH=66 /DNA_ID=CAMNT_0004518137 /DNA_START=201 /DNA_END=401 /DNA_ORIENTATION=+
MYEQGYVYNSTTGKYEQMSGNSTYVPVDPTDVVVPDASNSTVITDNNQTVPDATNITVPDVTPVSN